MTAVVRVVPDVTGLDKAFDYAVPAELDGRVALGSIVRVPLAGRRVAGWVVELDPAADAVDGDRLLRVARVSSFGPSAELIELARWASIRWAAGRLRPFLVAASPPSHVVALPPPAARRERVEPFARGRRKRPGSPPALLRLPPNDDLQPVIVAAARLGPVLVVVPSVDRRGERPAVSAAPSCPWRSCRRSGRAPAGVDVVIGGRAAAWAPCPGLAAAVVVDEHDEALQEERSPTWHARDVVVERARAAGAAALLTSPSPTVSGLAAVGDRLVRPATDEERARRGRSSRSSTARVRNRGRRRSSRRR